MNNRLFYIFLLFCFLISSISYAQTKDSSAHKPDKERTKYVLDGKTYTSNQLVYDFINIAFQKQPWFQDSLTFNEINGHYMSTPKKNENNEDVRKNYKVYEPWLYEYIYREKGRPRFDSINRWPADITIGLGWPPVVEESEHDAVLNKNSEISKKIESLLPEIIADLKKATGRNVKLIPRSKETKKDFAGLRILTYDFFDQEQTFRSFRSFRDLAPYKTISTKLFEAFILDGVRFTPGVTQHVEGYFISDNKNNIDFSTCQISPKTSDTLLKPLLTECLVRAMGLPEISETKKSILGDWFKRFSEESSKSEAVPDYLSEYDQKMISILYCKDLSVGMNRLEVFKTLTDTWKCLTDRGQK